MRRLFLIAGLLALLAVTAHAENSTVSVLDFGETPFAKKTAANLREHLRSKVELLVADADLSRAAAKGIGYSGSLNLSVNEARDLGEVVREVGVRHDDVLAAGGREPGQIRAAVAGA